MAAQELHEALAVDIDSHPCDIVCVGGTYILRCQRPQRAIQLLQVLLHRGCLRQDVGIQLHLVVIEAQGERQQGIVLRTDAQLVQQRARLKGKDFGSHDSSQGLVGVLQGGIEQLSHPAVLALLFEERGHLCAHSFLRSTCGRAHHQRLAAVKSHEPLPAEHHPVVAAL